MGEDGGLRRALLELHRSLLEAQRIEAERLSGRMSAAETLQAAADDLRFSWLRPLAELITELDARLADPEAGPGEIDALVGRARELFSPPDPRAPFGRRYLRALQDDPAVVMAHRDVAAELDRLP